MEKDIFIIDVWDFGACIIEDNETEEKIIKYNNLLTVDVLNNIYDSKIDKGSSANNFPLSFCVQNLRWISERNDNRLRTTNKNLTRYDENTFFITSIGDAKNLSGCLYLQSYKDAGYFEIELKKNDLVNIYIKCDNSNDIVFFIDKNSQKIISSKEVFTSGTQVSFVAPSDGTYIIKDSDNFGKTRYYRITREHSIEVNITGKISTKDRISDDYKLILCNHITKETIAVDVNNNKFAVRLPTFLKPVKYTISIASNNTNLDGYVIDGNVSIYAMKNREYNIKIIKLDLVKMSGLLKKEEFYDSIEKNIKILPKNGHNYYPSIYMKDSSTYETFLEKNITYQIVLLKGRDHIISPGICMLESSSNVDMNIMAKEKYKIDFKFKELKKEDLDDVFIILTDVYDRDKEYTFNNLEKVYVQKGIYTVKILTKTVYKQKITSNLVVKDRKITKKIEFKKENFWRIEQDKFDIFNCEYGMYDGIILENVRYEKKLMSVDENSIIKIPVQKKTKIVIKCKDADNNIKDIVYDNDAIGYFEVKFCEQLQIISIKVLKKIDYRPIITVGDTDDAEYSSINDALYAIECMKRNEEQRVVISVKPGNYEEMLVITQDNISIINASVRANIKVCNKGVDIDKDAVRITSYYGFGYNYYSMEYNTIYNEEVLAANKENNMYSLKNTGAGYTNESYWNATVRVYAKGFEAEGIIFENSFNIYISKKETKDILVIGDENSMGIRPVGVESYGNTCVQASKYTERAAALALAKGSDKAVFNECRFIGKMDTLFGRDKTRALFENCVIQGDYDFIFGGMSAVFYKCDLLISASDNEQEFYIAAPQQKDTRGFLFYECTIKSSLPGVDNASINSVKKGYLCRAWLPKTSEAVFYKTCIEATQFPGVEGESLILDEGYSDTLGGEGMCYEYKTIEMAHGVDNSKKRISWAKVLDEPVLDDGTDITIENFLCGNDNWNPMEND